jgi:hypothetical protein
MTHFTDRFVEAREEQFHNQFGFLFKYDLGNKLEANLKAFLRSSLLDFAKEIRREVEFEIAGLTGIIESNIRDTGQAHLAEMKLANILALLPEETQHPNE